MVEHDNIQRENERSQKGLDGDNGKKYVEIEKTESSKKVQIPPALFPQKLKKAKNNLYF